MRQTRAQYNIHRRATLSCVVRIIIMFMTNDYKILHPKQPDGSYVFVCEPWDAGCIQAHIWHCGDDTCDCYQPRIDHLVPIHHPSLGRPGYRIETLWEGSFISGPTLDEMKMLRRELATELRRRRNLAR